MNNDYAQFNETLWGYYAEHGRHELPWRQPPLEAYATLVSELMLQQTQVSRVIPKFNEFLMKYPTVGQLAQAPLGDILLAWSGLGYNRRAKFLWLAAQKVVADFNGEVPRDLANLLLLPGVGANTAGAIIAYAFNEPAVFLETNVRTVYIHHFFNDQTDVPDTVIREKLEATLDGEEPREFYWALMDYGSHLKQTVGNVSKHSATYTKQSRFEGSKRQVRGQVLRALAAGPQKFNELKQAITDERLETVLGELVHEKLINNQDGRYWL